MDRVVRTQIIRIVTVYVALIALLVWQNQFVMAGIEANPYLNLLIISVFLFGSMRGLASLVGLSNEGAALEALKEAYGDAVHARERHAEDPIWRHARCFEPGRRFRRPQILGSVYDLALDEIRRSDQMRISLDTMHNLLITVDRKISEERSLLGYLTGLCIFLGLIGTFIGLMEMVGSVGGIIGGLARADDTSTDTIKQLIRDLEAPLIGMATGFSASLFGLFGSLVLGLLGRLAGKATSVVRDDLEAWLGGMASIEGRRAPGPTILGRVGLQAGLSDHGAGPGSDADRMRPARLSHPGEGANAAALGGTALAVVGSARRTQQVLDRATHALGLIAERQDAQNGLLSDLCRRFEGLSNDNRVLQQALSATLDGQREVATLGEGLQSGLDTLGQRIDRGFERIGSDLARHLGDLGQTMAGVADRQTSALAQSLEAGHRIEQAAHAMVTTTVARVEEQAEAVRAQLAGEAQAHRDGIGLVLQGLQRVETAIADVGGRTLTVLGDRLERQGGEVARLGGRVADAASRLAELASTLDEDRDRQGQIELRRSLADNAMMDRLAQGQSDVARSLADVAAAVAGDRLALAEGLRGALASGLRDVADVLDASRREMGGILAALSEQQGALARMVGADTGSAALADAMRRIEVTLDRGLSQGFEGLTRTIGESAEAARVLAEMPLPIADASAAASEVDADDDAFDATVLADQLPRLKHLALEAARR